MKNKLTIILYLLLSINLHAQDFIKSDSIFVSGQKYNTVNLGFDKTSHTKFFKVLSCDSKHEDAIIKELKRCFNKYKYEYRQVFIVFIPNLNKLNSETENKIIQIYLEEIDEKRMATNLSTALVKCTFDYIKNIYTYHLEKPRNDLNTIKIICNRVTPEQINACMWKS